MTMTQLVVIGTVALGLVSRPVRAADTDRDTDANTLERIYYDWVDDAGQLRGGRASLLIGRPGSLPVIPAHARTLCARGGSPGNRIDLVTVGDGYTAGQLGLYNTHVNAALATFFSQEPYLTYQNFFNIHAVDVISNESGVDNDPVPGIYRDTALDMAFWCENIERLLCVNVAKAYAYAANAPDVDLVLAIAHSSKYGGAGYPDSNLATVAGGNSSAAEIALHEFGHSFDLADEYDYGGDPVYHGPEPVERNVSTLDAVAMAAAGTKWAPWLGEYFAAFDGLVDTYEGAYYSQYGIYRPSSNSKMRSLYRPYNLPSVEGLVIEFYKTVRPIDDATPAAQVLAGTETVFVDPVDPVGAGLDIQWFLDGVLIWDVYDTVDLLGVPLTPGPHALAVTVVDNTWFVRDEAARAQWMTETRTWTIQVDSQLGDLDCDGITDFGDINPFVQILADQAAWQAAYPECNWRNGDCNLDAAITFDDIDAFVLILPD